MTEISYMNTYYINSYVDSNSYEKPNILQIQSKTYKFTFDNYQRLSIIYKETLVESDDSWLFSGVPNQYFNVQVENINKEINAVTYDALGDQVIGDVTVSMSHFKTVHTRKYPKI